MKKDIIQTVKILFAATVLALGMNYVYAWTAPVSAPPAGNTPAPINEGTGSQSKEGNLTIGSTATPTNTFEVYGSVLVGGTANFLNDITSTGNICDADGCVGAETDPTVISSVKDGVSWGEVTGKPAGFADNVDNIGSLSVVTATASGSGTITANCPGGYVVTGGGFRGNTSASSWPNGNTGWSASTGGLGSNGTVYARCARIQ